ncbi:hypothetical protein GC170_18070 [bacterium]|nr:hypothetical protein [bacterium]
MLDSQIHCERPRSKAFRRSAIGFGLSAIGLGALCADNILELGYILSFAPQLRKLLLNPVWRLGVGGAITWLTFFGSYMLWLRFETPKWARASTLLLIMNATHVAFWVAAHHTELGLQDLQIEHSWLRHQISQIMNWAEFACWIALGRELNRISLEFETPEVDQRRFLAYSGFVVLGMVVAILVGGILTDWSAWPLERVVWLSPMDSLMLATATTMIMLAACMQMTLACWRGMSLCRVIAAHAAELDPPRQHWTIDHFDEDPWGIRAELPQEFRN